MSGLTIEQLVSLELVAYPSTFHLEGSKLQRGDKSTKLKKKPILRVKDYAGRYVVLEEKLDGTQAGISFDKNANLLTQTRGHYHTGGWNERQFNLFKPWVRVHEEWLFERLGDQYVMFGEWCFAKHSMFYDALPHYFFEFDVWCRSTSRFLSTAERHKLLAGGPIAHVPVLYKGPMPNSKDPIIAHIVQSLARTPDWRKGFAQQISRVGLNVEAMMLASDKEDLAEGIYGKFENELTTEDRFKFVRASFTQTILDAEQHYASMQLIPNLLIEGVDMYSPTLTHNWPEQYRG